MKMMETDEQGKPSCVGTVGKSASNCSSLSDAVALQVGMMTVYTVARRMISSVTLLAYFEY